jgi:hypothetical protein
MMRQFVCAVMPVATSVMATSTHAAMGVVYPAFLQNLDARPKTVLLVLLMPPQECVFELPAGGVSTRMADWKMTTRDNLDNLT